MNKINELKSELNKLKAMVYDCLVQEQMIKHQTNELNKRIGSITSELNQKEIENKNADSVES